MVLRCALSFGLAVMSSAVAAQDGPRPLPSLILGFAAPSVSTATPSFEISFQSAYADPLLREALRVEDPEMFSGMLQAGLLDPPLGDLPRAIQQELQRMGCYQLDLDGKFGRGSRQAVERYFGEVGAPVPALVPSVDLYRAIVTRAPVTCPPPPARPTNVTTRPQIGPTAPPTVPVREPDPPPLREIDLMRPTIGGRG